MSMATQNMSNKAKIQNNTDKDLRNRFYTTPWSINIHRVKAKIHTKLHNRKIHRKEQRGTKLSHDVTRDRSLIQLRILTPYDPDYALVSPKNQRIENDGIGAKKTQNHQKKNERMA